MNPIRWIAERSRFYIAIPDLLLWLLALALFWRPLATFVFEGMDWVKMQVPWPGWFPELALNIFADLLAAVIIGLGLLFFLRSRNLRAMAGRFRAFDTTGGKNETWGEVLLAYQITGGSSTGPRMRVRFENADKILHGECIVVQDQHLVGFYREVSQPVRRRCGAFFLTLSGNGDEYSGQFIFLDPQTNTPSPGTVRWTRA